VPCFDVSCTIPIENVSTRKFSPAKLLWQDPMNGLFLISNRMPYMEKLRILFLHFLEISPKKLLTPPNKGPPWTIGCTLFLGPGGGLLFGHWPTFCCQFPFKFSSKGGDLLFVPFFLWWSGWTSIRKWKKTRRRWTFIRVGGCLRCSQSIQYPFSPLVWF